MEKEKSAPPQPDRLLTPRQKRWAPRVRSGCLTCRKRRLKCDEAKPRCKNCFTADRECVGSGYHIIPAVEKDESPPLPSPVTPVSVVTFNGSSDVKDLLYLVPLMNSTLKSTSDDPRKAVRMMTEGMLGYLPSRAGHNLALDAAAGCVAAAVRNACETSAVAQTDCLFIEKTDSKMLKLYAYALQCLQRAVNDPEESVSAETLCATELLCYFESLQQGGAQGLNQHVLGLARMIQHRGPAGFRTDFERTLVLNRLSLISSYAFFNNVRCFLFQKDWTQIIESTASKATGRMRTFLDVQLYAAPILDMVVESTALILSKDATDRHTSSDRKYLLEKLHKLRRPFLKWFHDLMETFGRPDLDAIGLIEYCHTKPGLKSFCDYLAAGPGACLVHQRLHVALGGEGASRVEQQSQKLARNLALMFQRHADDPTFAKPIIMVSVVKATLATADEWRQFGASSASGGKLVPAETFRRWVKLIGVNI